MKARIKIILFLIAALLYVSNANAQNVIKAGTILNVRSNVEVRAKNVNVGDLVEFEIYEDYKVGDSIVVPKGSKAFAKVLVSKKSGMAGTKGQLKIEFVYARTPSGLQIPLEGEIDFARKNHTAGAVAAAAIVATPLIF